MTRFVLHVGPHKTASTYIQARFTGHRADLAAQGVIYPTIWTGESSPHSHFGLVTRIRDGDWEGVEAGCGALRRMQADAVVLSAEDFSTLAAPDLARLRDMLGGSVEIVYMLRRWSGLLPSVASEDIRQGSVRTLPEILLGHFAAPFASRLLNQALRLDLLAEVFGRDQLRVLIYDEIIAAGQDVFRCLLEGVLGLRDPPAIAPAVIHPSAAPVATEMLRLANLLRRQGRITPVSWQPDAFLAAAAGRELDRLAALMEQTRSAVVIDDRAPPLAALHRRLAEGFGDRVVGPRHPGPSRLFAPQRRQVAYISPDYLLAPGAAALAAGLCATACGEPARSGGQAGGQGGPREHV